MIHRWATGVLHTCGLSSVSQLFALIYKTEYFATELFSYIRETLVALLSVQIFINNKAF